MKLPNMLPLYGWYPLWMLVNFIAFLLLLASAGSAGEALIFTFIILLPVGQSIAIGYASRSKRAIFWMAHSFVGVLIVSNWFFFYSLRYEWFWLFLAELLLGEVLLYFIFQKFSRFRWTLFNLLALGITYLFMQSSGTDGLRGNFIITLGIFMLFAAISGLGIAFGFPPAEIEEQASGSTRT